MAPFAIFFQKHLHILHAVHSVTLSRLHRWIRSTWKRRQHKNLFPHTHSFRFCFLFFLLSLTLETRFIRRFGADIRCCLCFHFFFKSICFLFGGVICHIFDTIYHLLNLGRKREKEHFRWFGCMYWQYPIYITQLQKAFINICAYIHPALFLYDTLMAKRTPF